MFIILRLCVRTRCMYIYIYVGIVTHKNLYRYLNTTRPLAIIITSRIGIWAKRFVLQRHSFNGYLCCVYILKQFSFFSSFYACVCVFYILFFVLFVSFSFHNHLSYYTYNIHIELNGTDFWPISLDLAKGIYICTYIKRKYI